MILGRANCGRFEEACRREWLVTNRLGGYACGTVGGAATRRYHGFLIASLAPPVGRTLLVAKIDVAIEYLGHRYELAANEFAGGAIDPRGFVHIESFTVEEGVPTWRYALADALIEQRIFMAPEAQTSYLTLEVKRASGPMRCELKPLVTYRDHHTQTRGAQPIEMQVEGSRLKLRAAAGVHPFEVSVAHARFKRIGEWYWNFFHREEYARGLDALEDLFAPGVFEVALEPGRPVELCASAEIAQAPAAEVAAAVVARAQARRAALPASAPPWIQTLAIATDAFLARRGETSGASTTIIAGYPWFSDWGRDTMISLPGLTTALGRHDIARAVLRTYAGFIDQGMLPNRFPDEAAPPEYNTADATLWFFRALDEHMGSARDAELGRALLPALMSIIRAHIEGTRFGIRADPTDGLLHAGQRGTQLTWMDAKQGGAVFTPRIGKPVEINALWLNALEVTARLAKSARSAGDQQLCSEWLARASAGFQRFWNAASGCLFDVLDVDDRGEPDARLRPNQIFAVALPYTTLSLEQMRGVVDACAHDLLTSYGLRSLRPADPDYHPHYRGNAWERDAAYHQGTVWSWLLGPFALAHHRAYGDARAAQAFLEPIAQHLADACLGQVSEIFEGEPPHEPRGCFAQAWSVAEILRAWIVLEGARSAAGARPASGRRRAAPSSRAPARPRKAPETKPPRS